MLAPVCYLDALQDHTAKRKRTSWATLGAVELFQLHGMKLGKRKQSIRVIMTGLGLQVVMGRIGAWGKAAPTEPTAALLHATLSASPRIS